MAVDAVDLLGALVEEQVPVGLFLVGQDAQQNEAAHDGVVDLGVVELLVGVVHRLGVNAQAAVGVVLDLDGEVAADGFHEHAVLDGHVRVPALAEVVAGGALPLELVARGEDKLVVEAVAQVLECARRVIDPPLEDLHLVRAATDLHDEVQVGADPVELQEGGVLVVAVEVGEVLAELRVGQGRLAGGVQRVVARGAVVHGEHILDPQVGAQAEVDVVAEDEAPPAQRGQVARHAVVVGGEPRGGEQRGLDAAEHRHAVGVQALEARAQLRRVAVQALADDLVGAGLQGGAGGGRMGASDIGSGSAVRASPSLGGEHAAAGFLGQAEAARGAPSMACTRPRVASSGFRLSMRSSRAESERFFASSLVMPNWSDNCRIWPLKYSGSPLKNVSLMSERVRLLPTMRSTARPWPMAWVIWLKKVDSPPTISILADLSASPSTAACWVAMSRWMWMPASSTALAFSRLSLNSSCWRPASSSSFMAAAFFGDALGFGGELELRDLGIDLALLLRGLGLGELHPRRAQSSAPRPRCGASARAFPPPTPWRRLPARRPA